MKVAMLDATTTLSLHTFGTKLSLVPPPAKYLNFVSLPRKGEVRCNLQASQLYLLFNCRLIVSGKLIVIL